ncbi:MAG: DNA polymerase [bacterium]
MNYQVLRGAEHLERIITAETVAFDSETLQLQPEEGKLRLLQFGDSKTNTIVLVDLFETDEQDYALLDEFFEQRERNWVAHNAVFDIGWLQECGFKPRGVFNCTMIASKLLLNGIPNLKHGLANVVQRCLNKKLDKEQQASNWGAPVLTDEQLNYAAKDVVALLNIWPILCENLTAQHLMPAYGLECKALQAMALMWRTGLHWNRSSLIQLREDYEHDIGALSKEFLFDLDTALPEKHKLPREQCQRLDYLKEKVTEMGHDDHVYEKWYAEIETLEKQPTVFNLRTKDEGSIRLGTKKYKGFNLNSPKQLLEKFTALLGEPPIDSKTNKPSASRTALQAYAADHHVVQTYLQWKKVEKRRQMVDSILEKLDSNDYVRASYLQLGAESGRMSCIKPNLQQIPRDKEFRNCVEAPDGYLLVDADFGQMELRLAAAVAKDEKMIQAFKDGEDLHTVTAEAIGCSRQIAKSANFGLLYGSGANGLRNYAASSGVTMTLDEAADIRNGWLDTYQGIAAWQKQNQRDAEIAKGNPSIRIPVSGMRRFLPGDMNRLTVRCNTPIQGAGAAILKCALGNLWYALYQVGELEARIAACVHDEILLLVREDRAEYWASQLKQIMESAESKWLGEIPPLAEPSIGKRWSEIH